MLVLSRKPGESIVVNFNGATAVFTVLEISGTKTRIGIEADAAIGVVRRELLIDAAGPDAQHGVAPAPEDAGKEAGGSMRQGFMPGPDRGCPSPLDAVDSESRTAGQPLEV